jgi:hypothetical protein
VSRAKVVVHVHVHGREVATVRAYADGTIDITPPDNQLADAIRSVARGGEWVQSPQPGMGGEATLDGDQTLVALTIARGVYVVMHEAACKSRYLWSGENDPPGTVY